ncbi:MAG: carboxypeptidase-like regulatory domain-containing protein, partial [Prevotella sp.]|nr:carboxypeptidase-like regulatory domain-containing protein [Prevotella sp.]
MKKRLFTLLLAVAAVLSTAAQTTITGNVVDARTGETIIGATIVPKSSKELGTVTDIDGNFTLTTNVQLPLTLSVQSVGYRTQEVDVYDSSEPIDIQLIDGSNRINEVVVIGYGQLRRQELTSA